ncbi:hypothetical protein CapIbe_014553 [Capra ibex]
MLQANSALEVREDFKARQARLGPLLGFAFWILNSLLRSRSAGSQPASPEMDGADQHREGVMHGDAMSLIQDVDGIYYIKIFLLE